MTNGTTRLIVVDDLESNRYVVSTWLRRAGFHVVEARTGAEALQKLDAEPFDLAVLDVHLPDMSGYEVCRYIKESPALAAMPVLHISATATTAIDRSEGLRRGAEGYLVEPVEQEELVATVEALLRAAKAHQTSVRLAGRLRQLHLSTVAISEVQETELLLRAIAREAAKLFARPAVVLFATGDETYASRCDAGENPELHQLRNGSSPSIAALPTDGEVSYEEVRTAVPAQALVNAESYIVADISRRDDQTGRLLIAAESSTDEEEQRVVLEQLARVAEAALHNCRTHDIERHIAVTLQRGLLPETIPSIRGYDVGVRYEASALHAEVGGDFYDIFEGGDGRVFLAIGDVGGHSVEAATVMAQLRTAFRAYALEGHDPVSTLRHLNELLMRFHTNATATVCCGWLEQRTGECVLANAGHVPPLFISNGTARFYATNEPLLGLTFDRSAFHITLGPGDSLLFFTDGLVERRGERIDEGLQRLANVASRPFATMEDLCRCAFAELRPGNVDDDVAIMAIRRDG